MSGHDINEWKQSWMNKFKNQFDNGNAIPQDNWML